MHPCGLKASEKATCKSRPGHLVSSPWYLWIVHECDFRLVAKMDFSIWDHKVAFPKYSRIPYTAKLLKGKAFVVVHKIYYSPENFCSVAIMYCTQQVIQGVRLAEKP